MTSGSKICEMEPYPPGECMPVRHGLSGALPILRAFGLGEVISGTKGAGISDSMLSISPSPKVLEPSEASCSHDKMEPRARDLSRIVGESSKSGGVRERWGRLVRGFDGRGGVLKVLWLRGA